MLAHIRNTNVSHEWNIMLQAIIVIVVAIYDDLLQCHKDYVLAEYL